VNAGVHQHGHVHTLNIHFHVHIHVPAHDYVYLDVHLLRMNKQQTQLGLKPIHNSLISKTAAVRIF
jgi:hypothetical protein